MLKRGSSTRKILSVVSVSVKKLHGYGHLEEIAVRRVDRQVYKFKEGDFVDLHLNDIEDMLLLAVQHKLFQLDDSDIVDLIVAYHQSYGGEASVPMSQSNIKKDKIRQTPSSTQKNKVEAHPRKVKSSLKNKDCVVQPKGTAHVQHSKINANSELKCVKCNGCMLSDNHDLCVLDFINNVNARNKSKSVKKSSKRKVYVGNTKSVGHFQVVIVLARSLCND
ncbi:hypothetical protein Tco_1012550 [Tanacetum coccineum]